MEEVLASSWGSYPKVYTLGHNAIRTLLSGPVVVEEKIDGSQFSFGLIGGRVMMKSHHQVLNLDAPPKMFKAAVEAVLSVALSLKSGWTYRAEYLEKPKHNVLAYDRVPRNHLIIFDVNPTREAYLGPHEKMEEATRLGFESVPSFKIGMIESPEEVREFLDRESTLGGQKIEGVVIKNYQVYGLDGHVLMGKFVSERFKEVTARKWRKSNPTPRDIISELITTYRTAARWDKAVLHLTEAGILEGSPRDIGKLVEEVPKDILAECGDEIRERLFNYAWPAIRRGVLAGLAEHYKARLLGRQFEQDPSLA